MCIDVTFLLLDIRAPVYIILIEDGNGESVIVAVGILTTEDTVTLSWFLRMFKELNPCWNQVRNIMTEKDWNERNIIQQEFPAAQVLICVFHTFKIFQRAVTCEGRKITSNERQLALSILQKIVYSRTDDEFQSMKELMEAALSPSVLNYLNVNWEPIRSEWCHLLGETTMNFLNSTNNRLESLNSALKEVLKKYSNFQEFMDGLFTHIESSQIQMDIRASNMLQKVPVSFYNAQHHEGKYLRHLTDYSLQKLKPHLQDFKKVTFEKCQDFYNVKSTIGLLKATISSCSGSQSIFVAEHGLINTFSCTIRRFICFRQQLWCHMSTSVTVSGCSMETEISGF